jgi:2'-5' RNA ligase
MRLFTALDIPDPIRKEVDNLVQKLRPTARLRWSPAANLHITTKFIGEVPKEELASVKEALRSVPTSGPIRIGVRQIGWLPNMRNPRLIYLGIEAPEALSELHAATDAAMGQLGIPREKKPFRPHLTIARIPQVATIDKLKEELDKVLPLDLGEFDAKEFGLYESRLQPQGSVYTRLLTYPL